MFRSLRGGVRIHGAAGSLILGEKTAVTLRGWTIHRNPAQQWILSAVVAHAHPIYSQRRPLYFAAPRAQGFWCWGVETLDIGPTRLVARLGPPEQ